MNNPKTITVPFEEFTDLMFWLDRCYDKGHLERCSDLIEPYEKFVAVFYNTPAAPDPCPGCRVGTVCRTPSCGRLKG